MSDILLRHERDLEIGEVIRVAIGGERVALDPETRGILAERRRQIVAFVQSTGQPAYGFNRGFGHNVKDAVDPENAALLQQNLIRSHSCGVGEAAPREVVRAAMLLRARSLSRGYSGVRPIVVETLIDALNADIVPVVPRHGSVSASGDLAPLSHIALGMMGEGEVEVARSREPAATAMARAGIAPLTLDMKEGLALSNGVQYSAALLVVALHRLERLIDTAYLATALSTQVMLGSAAPFREDLHALRPHAGAQKAARRISALLADSPIIEAHRPYDIDGEIQDPYNLRCAAQVLGAAAELLERTRRTLAIEINAVTDNPILLPAQPDRGFDSALAGQFVNIVSGGHFHGMPVAIDAYGLIQAAAVIASLSNARCARYVDEARNKGLGADLKWPGPNADPSWNARQSVWSGMMVPEYVSASLSNWLLGQAMPTHLFSIPTDAGQEDHVSMAANVALRALDTIPRLAETLAVELAFAAQAAAIRKAMDYIPSRVFHTDQTGTRVERFHWTPEQRRLSPACEAALEAIARVFPTVTEDRPLSGDLQALAGRVADGTILDAAIGALPGAW